MNEKRRYSLKIADIYLDIESCEDPYTEKIFAPYICTESQNGIKIVCSRTCDAIELPEGEKLTDKLSCNWYSAGSGKYTMIFKEPDEDFICARADYDNEAKSARVVLVDVARLHGTDDEFFLSNILERLFSLILVFSGGFAVHASSIVHEGYGIAFSAVSGTGKSTHTGLWLTAYPGTYILNDDAPAMRQKDGQWYIYGTPWAGTTGINENSSAPLKALVFLERSDVNKIRTISALEGINRIFEAIIHPVSDEIMGILLSSVSSFITGSQLCLLGCNISEEAPKTVKKFLY